MGSASAGIQQELNSTFIFVFTVSLVSVIKQHLLSKHQLQNKSRGGSGAWTARGHDSITTALDSKWCTLSVTWRRHRSDRTIMDALSYCIREELLTTNFLSTLPLRNVHSPESVALASPTARCKKPSLSHAQPVNIVHMLKAFAGDTLSQIMHLLL